MSSNFFSLGSGVLSGLQSVDDDDDLLTQPKSSTTTPNSLQPEPVLKLATGVGREQPSTPTDVRRVEKALGRTGFLDMRQTHGPTGLFGSRLEDAVRRFQRKNNLKVDGFLNPGSETARALGGSLATEARKPRRGTTLQDRMSRNLDADGARRRAGLPALRHASASQNTRTLNALRKNNSLGLVPKLIADVLRARDPEGLTDVDDMFVQATVDDEPLARRLKSAVNGELSKQGRAERIRFRDLPSLRDLADDFDDTEDGDPGISDPSGDRPDNPPPSSGRVGDDVPGGDFEDEDGPGISDPGGDRPDNPLLPPEVAEPKVDCRKFEATVAKIEIELEEAQVKRDATATNLHGKRTELAKLEKPSDPQGDGSGKFPVPPVAKRMPDFGARGGGLKAVIAFLAAVVSGKKLDDAMDANSLHEQRRAVDAFTLRLDIGKLETELAKAVEQVRLKSGALRQSNANLAACRSRAE